MKAWIVAFALAALAAGLGGCAAGRGSLGWVTLIDGEKSLENFNRVGSADWKAEDGAIQAAGGSAPGYLVSRGSYGDFILRVEFWASDDANSGVFTRCQDPARISDETCYEANIFDQRPDPTYATGAIVKLAPVAEPRPKAGGRWNTYEITMRGPRLTLVLNGRKTVDIQNEKFAAGPIALQWVQGAIKLRKVQIKPI